MLTEIAQIREEVSKELRLAMNGQEVDKDKVYQLIGRYGELEGTMSCLYASHFREISRSLTAEQAAALLTIRDLDVVPEGAYRYSSPVAMPVIPDNDYLFGLGDMPSDAGNYTPPAGFTDP
ncbi:MAG: hypothetical protein MUC31_05075, partial [Bacteroidales bacterium]|nr:hypothetical protein [Bacteroidales bacterium]